MTTRGPRPGDILLVTFPEHDQRGHEQEGFRPALVPEGGGRLDPASAQRTQRKGRGPDPARFVGKAVGPCGPGKDHNGASPAGPEPWRRRVLTTRVARAWARSKESFMHGARTHSSPALVATALRTTSIS